MHLRRPLALPWAAHGLLNTLDQRPPHTVISHWSTEREREADRHGGSAGTRR